VSLLCPCVCFCRKFFGKFDIKIFQDASTRSYRQY
jgi:hypothetical protein